MASAAERLAKDELKALDKVLRLFESFTSQPFLKEDRIEKETDPADADATTAAVTSITVKDYDIDETKLQTAISKMGADVTLTSTPAFCKMCMEKNLLISLSKNNEKLF